MSNRTLPETTKLLMRGREKIQNKNHWCKYYYNKNGRYCAVGAMCIDTYDIYAFDKAYVLMFDAIGRIPITQYNDDPSTTHEDVLKLFDKAIAASLKT